MGKGCTKLSHDPGHAMPGMKWAWAEDMLGRTKNSPGFVGSTPQRPIYSFGKSVGMLGKSVLGLAFWFHSVSLPAFVVAMACSIAGAKISQKMWEGAYWEGVWPCLDPQDVVRSRSISQLLE